MPNVGPEDWRPTVAQVAAILRARTYADGGSESEAGEEVGNFDATTRPTGDEVEELIDLAVAEVVMRVAEFVPVSLEGSIQRLAAIGAAREVEKSLIPEQAEGSQSIYQTLRLSFDAEVEQFGKTMQWLVLAGRLEAEAESE